jgi:hypothetical protein
MDQEIADAVILLRRMAQFMGQQSAVDQANRQRITVDAIAAGLTLAAVTTVSTVSTVTSVTSVGNIAATAGEGIRQFEVPARNCYANAIRNKLTFG